MVCWNLRHIQQTSNRHSPVPRRQNLPALGQSQDHRGTRPLQWLCCPGAMLLLLLLPVLPDSADMEVDVVCCRVVL